jgi:hypothetical protein
MPWDRPASLATSPSVVLPSPFLEMHLIVASISCCRRRALAMARRLDLGTSSVVADSA